MGQSLVFKTKNLKCDEDRLKIINRYFFEEPGFETIKESRLNFQNSLLPSVLSRHQSPIPLFMLIFCCFLEECGLKARNISCELANLLKIQVNGSPRIINIDCRGEFLKPHEITDLINKGLDFSNNWLDSRTLVIKYLNLIKKLARKTENLQTLSLIHSYLMKYQPFNLKHLADRAMISFERGDYQKTIEDIRSYFQYSRSDEPNQALKKLYKMALLRQKSGKEKPLSIEP